jgi:LPLT family lysophospholipid transporter-like MFS transporter
MRPLPKNLLELVPDFWNCNARLWRDKLGQISLATTTLFWGVSGNLRYIILAWSAAALGYSTTQASSLAAWWPWARPWAPSSPPCACAWTRPPA